MNPDPAKNLNPDPEDPLNLDPVPDLSVFKPPDSDSESGSGSRRALVRIVNTASNPIISDTPWQSIIKNFYYPCRQLCDCQSFRFDLTRFLDRLCSSALPLPARLTVFEQIRRKVATLTEQSFSLNLRPQPGTAGPHGPFRKYKHLLFHS